VNARVNGDAFEDLHFSTGYRRTRTVGDLLDDRSCDVQAASDVNHAFTDCTDSGVLAAWVETPVCGASSGAGRGRHGRDESPVAGPEHGRCLAFDTECSRGRFDEESSCCAVEATPAGALCGASGRLCNGAGECVSAASVPTSSRVLAPANWLSVFSDGPPANDLIPRETAMVVPAFSAPAGMPADVVEIWAAPALDDLEPGFGPNTVVEDTGPGELDAEDGYQPDVLAIVPASLAGSARVTIFRSAIDSDLRAIGYDGPMVPHALVLATNGSPPNQVLVVRGAVDTLPTVMADGSTGGATAIACGAPSGPNDPLPGAPASVRCDVYPDRIIVVGADVSLVWIRPSDDRYDNAQVIDGTFGFPTRGDISPMPVGGLRQDMICQSQPCSLGATCTGIRLCYQGRLGACIVTRGAAASGGVEICDGLDNDCDTRVDENSAAICDDGISCTWDVCSSTTRTCLNQPFASLCGTALGPDGTACTTDVCTNAAGGTNSRLFVSAADIALATPTPGRLGCSVAVGHSWCTNTWDSCGCNGPEQCFPGTGAPGNRSGCGPVTGSTPASLTPCDPGSFCAVEALCCEPDSSFCRIDFAIAALPGGAAVLAQRDGVCRLPGGGASFAPAAPAIGIGALPVQCSPTGPPVPNCVDLNPCTTNVCNEAVGCLPPTFAPNATTRPAESLGFGISGPNCNAEFVAGCSDSMCNGFGTCVANPASLGSYPAGTNTNICFAGLTDDFCGRYACNGGGACAITQCAGLAPGDTTPACGGRPRGSPPDTDCVHDGCVNGACVADFPDSRLCPRPPGCSAQFTCDLQFFIRSHDPDLLRGCVPTTECYIGGSTSGTLNGECRAAGGPPGSCLFCDPVDRPFDLSSRRLGTSCSDGSDCTENDACQSFGVCAGECVPGCTDDEFCGVPG